ncbi:MAG: YceI family protein [Dokdonella sp.]|uniref:YceI family protein n=1 Tax=Dokdonella sp. TaxID=2291710 RepID=UPI003F7EAD0C
MNRTAIHTTVLLALATATSAATAAPVTYTLDPTHTYPSFEADHMGISYWRGRMDATSGKVVLDREARTGNVEVSIDLASIDFGMDKLDEWARGKDLLDTAKYPKATYKGRLARFVDGRPTEVVGTLDLHGVQKPLTLAIGRFKCIPHPIFKRELCGADATGTFDRAAFGLDAGKDYGFDMTVALRIQVEALRDE